MLFNIAILIYNDNFLVAWMMAFLTKVLTSVKYIHIVQM